MKTPDEKYMYDQEYKYCVDMLEKLIEQARFTPSELREMCVLACINYEMRHVRKQEIDYRTNEALKVLDEFVSKKNHGVIKK